VTGLGRHPGKALTGLLALGLLALLPVEAGAAGISFRNDLKTPVIVQGACIVNGVVRRRLPFVVQPGRVGADLNVPRGNQQITIYDANQPGRILFRDFIPFNGQNLGFVIGQTRGGTIQLTPAKAKMPGP
jgi:hypothetical protein